jgi:TRAP-type C4-dicarboxylate transport system permease small subunit
MKRKPLEWLSETMLTVTSIPVLAMMVHVTLDVALKYLFSFPIQGTLEITAYYYMVSVVVLPMAFIELTRQSIAVDLFYQMMSPKVQTVVTGLVLFVSALGYGSLAWIAVPDAFESFEKREIVMGTVNIYIWPSRFLLPAALAVATLVCLVHLWRLITDPKARFALIAIQQPDPETEAN